MAAGVADHRARGGQGPGVIGAADIVTNSGQVRPSRCRDRQLHEAFGRGSAHVRELGVPGGGSRPPGVPGRGIVVAGTNERHPAVDVFSFLGQMAVLQLHEAGIPVRGSRLLVVCDNDFSPFILRELERGSPGHASARSMRRLQPACDAVLLAVQPSDRPAVGPAEAELLSRMAPGAVLVQYWGDTDRWRSPLPTSRSGRLSRPRRGTWVCCPRPSGPNRSSGCRWRAQGGPGSGARARRGLGRRPRLRAGPVSLSPSFGRSMDTVLLIGLGPTALTALESLAARFRVAAVVRGPRTQRTTRSSPVPGGSGSR